MLSFPYVFKLTKAVQAVGVILKQMDDNSLDYYVLIKILYLADLKSLQQTGYQILESPLDNDATMGIVKEGPWNDNIEFDLDPESPNSEATVRLVEDPGVGQLCPYEVQILQTLAWILINEEEVEWL